MHALQFVNLLLYAIKYNLTTYVAVSNGNTIVLLLTMSSVCYICCGLVKIHAGLQNSMSGKSLMFVELVCLNLVTSFRGPSIVMLTKLGEGKRTSVILYAADESQLGVNLIQLSASIFQDFT